MHSFLTPKHPKNRTKLLTWAPVNGLHPLERYIAHYVTYKDYALLGWAVGGPELPRYTLYNLGGLASLA